MVAQNRLLDALTSADLQELQPHLDECELPYGSEIELPGRPVRYAHFFDRGFVSILIRVADRTMEVGLVGREGMLGLPAVLGTQLAEYRAVVREDAHARRIPVNVLQGFIQRRRVAGAVLLRFLQAGVAQITHLAFANAHLTISQRLARWLLMAHDRIDGDAIRVTHAILSEAIGARRSGVTLALSELESAGAVRTSHRSVTIVSRDRLVVEAAGSYGPAERAYRLLLGREISKL